MENICSSDIPVILTLAELLHASAPVHSGRKTGGRPAHAALLLPSELTDCHHLDAKQDTYDEISLLP